MEQKKLLMIVGIVVVVLIVIGGGIFVFGRDNEKVEPVQESQIEDESDEPIPTVGPEVQVELESADPGKEVILKVDGVPAGTTEIEYEFTYSTKEQETEGVFSTVRPKEGEKTFTKTFERKITLGTCSKNVCRYHSITSPIKVTVKFTGSYGDRLFLKEYPSDAL